MQISIKSKKKGIGGLAIEKDKIWTISYADDMVMVAKNRVAMLNMIDTFKRFLRMRKLELNAEKTKMLVFNRKRKE